MKKYYNLSYPQMSILLTENFYKNTNVNNICGTAIIKNKINFEILKEAINYVASSNQSFWIRFSRISGVLKQYISEPYKFEIDIVDIENESEIDYVEEDVVKKIFNIIDNNLFEFKIFRYHKHFGGFILNIHHLISDSWTLGLVCREIVATYEKMEKKVDYEFKEKLNYTDFLEQEEKYRLSTRYEKDKLYWDEQIKRDINPATIPSNKMVEQAELSSIGERIIYSISKNKMKLILDFCGKNKITTFNFLMSVYSIYISKILNSNSFSIGTPILNRTNHIEKNMTGMFINIMPFFFDIDSSATFLDYTMNVAKNTISMLRHQKYPYQLILEELRKKDISIPNLYNIVISYQLTKATTASDYEYKTRWAFGGSCVDDLTIQFLDLDIENKLTVMYDYKKIKYSSDYIRNIHSRVMNIINQIIENPSIKIKDIEVVNKYEKDKILNKFNNTRIDYDYNNNIIKQLDKIVKNNSSKVAIISNNEKITYKELEEKSNKLAENMLRHGVKHNDIVGIMTKRGIGLAVALVATSKCGATYLPIDPDYPTERIKYMLEDSGAKCILVCDETKDMIDYKINKINLSNKKVFDQTSTEKTLVNNIEPDDTAYIIYTSGSTGKPKGVMVTQKNLINFLMGTKQRIDFSKNKVMCSMTTICFDIFGLEFWGAITSGMTVVIANEREQTDFKKLNSLCNANNVSMIQTTPSRYKHMVESLRNQENCFLKSIKDILVGGEALSKTLVENIQKITNADIYNMYGPTETTIWSTIKKIKNTNITIGTPIANTICYILNDSLNLLPPYIPGELYIGGDGVSKGYKNREKLTKEKFIHSPFESDSIIYNTNDLAYYMDSGELVHLGRTDFQVKIRGYRIELGEIEEKINNIKAIKNSIVVPNKSKEYLICYYISDIEIEEDTISKYLLSKLPNYMVPSVYKKMKSFPLTPNGKLDTKKLPEVELKKNSIETCHTKTEKLLAKIIAEILDDRQIDYKDIDINAPFIVLGLDSLGIIQVQTKLLKYQYVLNTQEFYKYNTIKLLATNIDSNKYTYKEQDIEVPINFRHTYDELLSKIDKKVNDSRYLGNVFLTGANGFIGIHILRELISTTDISIYCLVRGKQKTSSINRLIENYKVYFDEDITNLIGNRVIVYNGDITDKNLELNEKSINEIQKNVSTVIHTAAKVKHYGDFEKFNAINIEGTRNVLDLAFNNGFRFIHLSSISVSGNYLVKQDNRNIEFNENSLYVGQKYTDNVYVNSKLEAEKLVLEYMEKGLIAQIHRIGILAGRYRDGVFQSNIDENAFYGRIKSMICLGAISEKMLNQRIEFTPVDLCTRDIVALAKNKIADRRIFHLFNHNFVRIGDIIKILDSYGIHVDVVSNSSFKKLLVDLSKDDDSTKLSGIINDITSSDDEELALNYNYTIKVKSDFTQMYLHLLKCDWNRNDKKYLRKLIRYAKKVGFI